MNELQLAANRPRNAPYRRFRVADIRAARACGLAQIAQFRRPLTLGARSGSLRADVPVGICLTELGPEVFFRCIHQLQDAGSKGSGGQRGQVMVYPDGDETLVVHDPAVGDRRNLGGAAEVDVPDRA
jgi:hypothetical protein